MKKTARHIAAVLVVVLMVVSSVPAAAANASAGPSDRRIEGLPSRQEVIDLMWKVNNYWQQHNDPKDAYVWEVAAYHHGNMEMYFLTGDEKLKNYTQTWAEHNGWCGMVSTRLTKKGVLHADNESCFQDYIDLYILDPSDEKIEQVLYAINYQIETEDVDYFWWVDALYMAMPVFTKLYRLTGNVKFLDKLYDYYSYAKDIMYDPAEGLWYRDASYVYPEHTSPSGGKVFWSRGMGWNVGAHAKVLSDMPDDHPSKQHYEEMFKTMMKSLVKHQHKDGYWTMNIVEEKHAPGPETSGTAFFAYALAWGINTGRLDTETYLPALVKAWNYLQNTAIQPSGLVGYVQPIGSKPVDSSEVTKDSTQPYAVGAFLLAAAEVSKLVGDMEGYLKPYLMRRMVGNVALKIGSPYAMAGTAITQIDAANAAVVPIIQNDRTLVPLRFIGESLGAEVNWDGDSSTVTIKRGNDTVVMAIGQNSFTVNGAGKYMDVPPQIIDGRTMVPLRAAAEAFSRKVYWDGESEIIVIGEQQNAFYPSCESGLLDYLENTLKTGSFPEA